MTNSSPLKLLIFGGSGVLGTAIAEKFKTHDYKVTYGVRTITNPVDQSYSERQLFEKAYDRLLGEVAIGMQLTNEDAKKKLDKALGKKEAVTAEPI